MEIKTKINKWNQTKLKNFEKKQKTKETISKVKRQTSEWEKIIAKEGTYKELISKIYKWPMQLNTRNMSNLIKKWANEIKRHFSKEDIHMDNKQEKMLNITHYSDQLG